MDIYIHKRAHNKKGPLLLLCLWFFLFLSVNVNPQLAFGLHFLHSDVHACLCCTYRLTLGHVHDLSAEHCRFLRICTTIFCSPCNLMSKVPLLKWEGRLCYEVSKGYNSHSTETQRWPLASSNGIVQHMFWGFPSCQAQCFFDWRTKIRSFQVNRKLLQPKNPTNNADELIRSGGKYCEHYYRSELDLPTLSPGHRLCDQPESGGSEKDWRI